MESAGKHYMFSIETMFGYPNMWRITCRENRTFRRATTERGGRSHPFAFAMNPARYSLEAMRVVPSESAGSGPK